MQKNRAIAEKCQLYINLAAFENNAIFRITSRYQIEILISRQLDFDEKSF